MTFSSSAFSGTAVLTLLHSSSITLRVAFANSGFQDGAFTNWTTAGTGWGIVNSVTCLSATTPNARNTSWTEANSEFHILNAADDSVLATKAFTPITSCVETEVDVSTLSADNIKIRVTDGTRTLTSPSFSRPSGIVGIIHRKISASNVIFDAPEPYYLSSGTYTTGVYDTAFTTPTWGPFLVLMSSNSTSTLLMQTEVAAAEGGPFDSAVSETNGAKATAAQKRYVRLKFSLGTSDVSATPSVSSFTLRAASTGTYRTQCIQPGSAINAWGTLNCSEQTSGNGSLVYYATSAASCASLPATTPNAWQTSVSNNATLSIATNTAVFIGWRSLLGSATDQAQVDACTLAWNEGTPAQPSWAVYDSVNGAIYWTTTINNAPYSNRLLKYDLNLGSWHPWSIAAQAPRMINNSLYFGGASSGTWSKYGLVDADNGNSIYAFWTGKDIGSDKPVNEKNFKTLSVLARNSQTGNLSATYTLSNGRTGDYTMSLSTGTGIEYARFAENLPLASPQNFVNVRLGNNSAVGFEVLGIVVTWHTLPWKTGGP